MSNNATTTVSNGRVRSIKSKFENLHTIESLDIGVPVLRQPSAATASKTPFMLKRSATSLDLPAKPKDVSVVNLPLAGNVRRPTAIADTAISGNKSIAAKIGIRRNMDVQRQASDSFLFKNRNVVVRSDQVKPLKEIKENVEVRLSRHTSDPVKRSSIKRSPAFRVGNGGVGGDKTASNGKLPLTKTLSAPKDYGTEKIDDLLKRCAPDDNDDNFDGISLTDTLKAALKQPLPTGPPPKKPPRTFETPSPKDDINPLAMFMNKKLNAPATTTNCSDNSGKNGHEQPEIKNKINYLEQKLVLNSAASTKQSRIDGNSANAHKEKSHLLANSFLSCIPCSSPIYDTFKVKQVNGITPVTNGYGHQPNGAAPTVTRQKGSEPIYMEPFGHLRMRKSVATGDHIDGSHRKSNGDADVTHKVNGHCTKSNNDHLDVSCSSCGDHQANLSDDIHYLVSENDKYTVTGVGVMGFFFSMVILGEIMFFLVDFHR